MGAQKTPVPEQSECQTRSLACFGSAATKKTGDYLTPFTPPAAIRSTAYLNPLAPEPQLSERAPLQGLAKRRIGKEHDKWKMPHDRSNELSAPAGKKLPAVSRSTRVPQH